MRFLLFIGAFWCVSALALVAQDKEGAVGVPSDSAPAAHPHNPKGEERPPDIYPPQTPAKDDSTAAKVISTDQLADPITSKKDTDDEIQRRDLEAQESMARAAWAMFWGAALQIGIGGVSIYLIYLTLRETRRTLTESEKATKAAQDAADASAEGVVVTRHIGNSQLRPWLSVSCQSAQGFRPSKPGHPEYIGYWLDSVFTIKNHGGSPASHVSLHVELAAFLPDDDQQNAMNSFCDQFGSEVPDSGQTVFPGDELVFNNPSFLAQSMIDGKATGKDFRAIMTLLYGCVCYTSPHTEGVRQTRFVFPVCQLRGGHLSAFRPDEEKWFEKGVIVASPVTMLTT